MKKSKKEEERGRGDRRGVTWLRGGVGEKVMREESIVKVCWMNCEGGRRGK